MFAFPSLVPAVLYQRLNKMIFVCRSAVACFLCPVVSTIPSRSFSVLSTPYANNTPIPYSVFLFPASDQFALSFQIFVVVSFVLPTCYSSCYYTGIFPFYPSNAVSILYFCASFLFLVYRGMDTQSSRRLPFNPCCVVVVNTQVRSCFLLTRITSKLWFCCSVRIPTNRDTRLFFRCPFFCFAKSDTKKVVYDFLVSLGRSSFLNQNVQYVSFFLFCCCAPMITNKTPTNLVSMLVLIVHYLPNNPWCLPSRFLDSFDQKT